LLLWIGSSIGNYTDADAVHLLAQMRRFLRSDALLVFGTDLIKDPETLRRAYDDARGVTAAFSKNLLVRLNREIGARFDVEAFRHVAEWNAEEANIECISRRRACSRCGWARLADTMCLGGANAFTPRPARSTTRGGSTVSSRRRVRSRLHTTRFGRADLRFTSLVRERCLEVTTMHSGSRAQAVPASFFGIVLGLTGLGNAWRTASSVWGLTALLR